MLNQWSTEVMKIFFIISEKNVNIRKRNDVCGEKLCIIKLLKLYNFIICCTFEKK